MKFKIGDSVRWTSDLHGVKVKKRGKIAYIVDSFSSLFDVIESGVLTKKFGKNFNIIYNKLNDYRPCESYLVIVKKGDGDMPILYWLDVDNLKKTIKREYKSKSIKEDEDENV